MLNDSLLQVTDKISTENGLVNDFIQSLAYDRQGRLWVSTMAGIAILDCKNKILKNSSVYVYGKEEDIQASGLEYGRLLCDDKGDMWYSTQNALLRFRVSEMTFNNSPPQISIENVLLNNQVTHWEKYTDSLTGIFRIPVHPVLKYYENTLTIAYKGITMNNAEQVQYSYLLSGINNYWSNSSKSNSIIFTKLKPGTYTFFVRARTNSLNWCTPALFSFTILRPYWQQWWFVTLILLAGTGIIYGLYRLRIGQLQKEKMIRNKIARDLHDDLGSTLNSVKVYANIASLEPWKREPLEKIKEGTQDAISSVRDLVWVLDEKKDTMEHLFVRVGQFAGPLCEANHVKYRQDLEDGLYDYVLNQEEKRNLYMIIKEAINNSIKYAGCRNITIAAASEKKKLRLTISDDGCGFDLEKVMKGHGLENILTRAKEIHYHAEFRSAPGEETNLILEKK